jgi:hypothetical protein
MSGPVQHRGRSRWTDLRSRVSRLVLRSIAIALLTVLLLSMPIVGSAIWRQHGRDLRCREEFQRGVAAIEGFRRIHGRPPSEAELPYYPWQEPGRSRCTYLSWPGDASELSKLGARGEQDYAVWCRRSQRHVYYFSWSLQDTCGSGMDKATLAFFGPTVPLAALITWYLLRRRRARAP